MDEDRIKTLLEQLDELIALGEKALKEDYHRSSNPGASVLDSISGDINDEWLSKAKVFCKRYIPDYPLCHDMLELIDEQNAIPKRAKKLLVDLKTLKDDNEYWKSKSHEDDNSVNKKTNNPSKPHKLFISHNTADKDYAEAFIGLLESLGLYQDEIICSSVPPYCVPLDDKVYDWLANEFQKSDLHMIFLLSKNYYASPASLNEMGAAWASKHRWTGILLPGFGFDEVKGCIDKTQVSIKLDDPDANTLEYRLDELKDNLIEEFDLRPMPEAIWKRKRDEFLGKVKRITEERAEEAKHSDHERSEPEDNKTKTVQISKEAAIILVYTAAFDNSDIMILPMMGGKVIQGGGYTFNQRGNAREEATWESAVEELYNYGLIKRTGKRDRIYQLTKAGYDAADKIKAEDDIDTSKNPAEYLG